MDKILWFCWPLEYKNSGVGKYSDIYIKNLKNKWLHIQDKWVKSKLWIFRALSQFLINPLKIILFYRKDIKIFRDEWMLIYTLFPFFPYKNSTYIIHDIRDFKLSAWNQNFLQKIYFYLVEKSYKNLNKAKTIIVPSEFTKNTLIKELKISKENIYVIYNPFDFNSLKKLKEKELKEKLFKKYNIKTNKKIILNVWSEESRKNIITILKVMKNVKDYIFIKIWKPVIKQNRIKHIKYIKENNIENNIVFIDYIEKMSDLVRFYNIADIFLFPSLFEGFGRPPIEAQACWCPVISSDKWWLKEVLKSSCILIQDPESVTEIIKKIEYIKDNNRQNIIELWYKNTKRFSVENNINNFIDIITDKNEKI